MSLSDHSVFLSSLHQLQTLFWIFHYYLVESLDINAILFIFMNNQFLLFGHFGVIFQQVSHVLVVDLEERAVNFDEFSPFDHNIIEQKMNASGNNSSVIFVLFDASQKSYLLLLAFFSKGTETCGFFPDNVVPIVAKHSVGLSTARLSIRKHRYVKTLAYFSQQRFNQGKYLPLSCGRPQSQLYFLVSFLTCNFDLKSILDENERTCPLRDITCGSSQPLRAGLSLTIVTILDLLLSPFSVYYIIFIMLRLTKRIPQRFISHRPLSALSTLSTKHWGIPDDYEALSSLGKGSSARVFMGFNVVTGEKVVIKIFKQLPVDTIRKEININLKLLSNLQEDTYAQFIHLRDTCYDIASSTFTLIYSFHHGVPLNQLITNTPIKVALRHILSLAHTLKYIHSQGIVHRDIKPANVLITKDGPKLFDFGLAKQFTPGEPIKINNFGTKCYKTPQVVYRMDTYTPAVDVWGLGIIMAQMALGKRHLMPYENQTVSLSQMASLCSLDKRDTHLFSRQLLGHIRISKSKSWDYMASRKDVDPLVIEVVRAMLQINPENRPTLDQLISHPVFRGISL